MLAVLNGLYVLSLLLLLLLLLLLIIIMGAYNV